MQIARTIEEVSRGPRRAGPVGLVPTMGYLHEGHLSLVRRARTESNKVVVTVFVNPTQFGPSEDFAKYPRDEARDIALLEQEGVDVVFLPCVDEIFPPGFNHWVDVEGPLAQRLDGEYRPGHFRGVATAVSRLLEIVQPDRAYFGQKDAQQLLVVRKLVSDMGLAVEIVGCPIVREADGLAMSSRNIYLSPSERQVALSLPRALSLAARLVEFEGERDPQAVIDCAADVLRGEPALHLEYLTVADAATLSDIAVLDRPALLLAAVRIGATRLIDNWLLSP